MTGTVGPTPVRRNMARALTQPAQMMQDAATGSPIVNVGGETANNDPRGRGAGQQNYGNFGDWAKATMQGLSMMGPIGFGMGVIGRDQNVRDAEAAIASMNQAGGVPNPELAGRSDPSQQGGGGAPGGGNPGGVSANDLGASLADGSSTPGVFHEGGFVMPEDLGVMDPPGPDPGLIGASPGEVVLTPEQQKKVGRDRIAKALMAR